MISSRGISLVELLLVLASLIVLVGIIGVIPNTLTLINQSRHKSLAREIAAKAIEETRQINFLNITNTPPGGEPVIDSRLTLLTSGSAKRVIRDCDLSICQNGEQDQVKEVRVTVSWQESGKDLDISLSTLVSKGGLNQ